MNKQLQSIVAVLAFATGAFAEAMNDPCDDETRQCKLYTSDDYTGDYWHYCHETNWDTAEYTTGYSFDGQFQGAQLGSISCGGNIVVELCNGDYETWYNEDKRMDQVHCATETYEVTYADDSFSAPANTADSILLHELMYYCEFVDCSIF